MKILIWVKLKDLYVLEKYLNNEIIQNDYQIEYSTKSWKFSGGYTEYNNRTGHIFQSQTKKISTSLKDPCSFF